MDINVKIMYAVLATIAVIGFFKIGSWIFDKAADSMIYKEFDTPDGMLEQLNNSNANMIFFDEKYDGLSFAHFSNGTFAVILDNSQDNEKTILGLFKYKTFVNQDLNNVQFVAFSDFYVLRIGDEVLFGNIS